MYGLNSASGRTLPDLPRSHKRAFATISTVITPVIITCSSFHLFTECRIILRPLTVHLRFELWLPIFGNSAQYFAVPVSYTHLRAHETRHDLVCRLLLEKKK